MRNLPLLSRLSKHNLKSATRMAMVTTLCVDRSRSEDAKRLAVQVSGGVYILFLAQHLTLLLLSLPFPNLFPVTWLSSSIIRNRALCPLVRSSLRSQSARDVRSSVIGWQSSYSLHIIHVKLRHCRAHPCGPCTRRNDQHKCQWHVIEPVYVRPCGFFWSHLVLTLDRSLRRDKYVSRAEHEQLKTRLSSVESRCDKLEAMLASLTGPPPFVQSPRPFDMPAVHGALRPAPAGPSGSFSLPFTDFQAPAPPFHTSVSAPSRDEEYSLLRHGPEQPTPSLRIMTSPAQPFHHLSVSQHSRPDIPSHSSQPLDARSPEIGNLASTSRVFDRSPPSSISFRPETITKPSPLSLSAITSPYNIPPAPQSKNSSAQTLKPLGERLRSRLHPQDSAAHSLPPDGCRYPHSLRPLLHAFTPAVVPA